jgi:predicted MFS family arabinose efflux permease
MTGPQPDGSDARMSPPAGVAPPVPADLPTSSSSFSPFRHVAFTVLWAATVVAYIGTWMYSATAAWLMTSLDPHPLVVSLVQVATTLPMLLFALPAGALADIVDRRWFLIGVEGATTAVAAVIALLVSLGAVNPTVLLVFTFLIGTGGALGAPAWQAVVPQLVPRADLTAAIAANSVGINISRAIGPALAGVITAIAGIAAPLWINAFANLVIVIALVWWRPPATRAHHLPAERLGNAIRTGVRYARHNSHLRATLMRAVGFFLVASAYWALLPLVARDQIATGPELYGVLVGAIGVGAIVCALALPRLKAALGPDGLVAAGTIGTAVALVLFGLARESVAALFGSLIAGAAWIAVLSSLNVSAQVALPEWVRGRGLALFVAVFFGALTFGSALWGEIASLVGLPLAHFLAAFTGVLVVPLTWRWKLQTGAAVDFSPSMHWPAPCTVRDVEADRGPVLVTVEYRIDPKEREPFLAAVHKLARQRRRDGAYAWGVFEDTGVEGRFVETFLVESWLEHLRQHERVTNADRVIEEAVHRFNCRGAPTVTHLVAAEFPNRSAGGESR